METKNAPLAIGGAALAAFLLAPLGNKLVTPPDPGPAPSAVAPQTAKPVLSAGSVRSAGLMRDETGPWYAICQEFASPQPDGTDVYIPPKPNELDRGTKPFQGDVEAVEVTKDGNKVTTKYSVKEHPPRDITACIPGGESPRLLFMLVGVPDPSASHMQLETDRTIDAIQHAAALKQYDFERYWLPWADPSNPHLPKGLREATLQEEKPGILIFTKHGKNFGNDTRLFVFLYGESPTFGANRLQLQNALRYIDVLSQHSILDSAPIGYVGAYFSASYPSISEILRTENERLRSRIAMVNANSADDELIAAFEVSMHGQIRSYESMDLRSSKVQDEAVRLAINLGYKEDEIAIVGEDESAFGNSIIVVRGDESAFGNGIKVMKEQHSLSLLNFPRDLSALRNAADSQAGSPGVVEIGGIAVPTLGVPLTRLRTHRSKVRRASIALFRPWYTV